LFWWVNWDPGREVLFDKNEHCIEKTRITETRSRYRQQSTGVAEKVGWYTGDRKPTQNFADRPSPDSGSKKKSP